jgi:hypothetical protein
MTIQQAFDNFMASDFEATVDSSTAASWGGGAYVVELFEDGTYRSLDKGSVGNLYDSPGLILTVPHLNDEDPRMVCGCNERADAACLAPAPAHERPG